ncbi:MAG TPA: PKD domain-containing protein, partial [Chthoniobacterales bacterium]|nr:PKD domain-containing protein [Chthoniobacterales bacterium]
KLERSNTFIDHTFVKAQTDNSYPAATYTVAGNIPCPVGANSPPIAVLHGTPTSGDAPLTVSFDATGSSDPDFGDTISNYHFDFGDGNQTDSGAPMVEHTYNNPGTYTPSLVVTDSRGLDSQNTSTEVITVSQVSPTPTPSPSASPSSSPTPTPTPTPSATASVSPSATPSPTPSPSATVSPTPTPTPSATPTATPLNVQLLNISGRVFTQGGDNVGIGGFIISGSSSKRIMARAIGTSLKASNGSPFPGRLQDPTLELHDNNSGSPSLFNDNWRTSQEAEILQSGLAPSEDNEAAIIKRLDPGQYTAIIRGADGAPGIGLIELYDLSENDPAELGNLSVRADAQLGDNVLINGLILRGGTAKRVVFRAIGPSIKGPDNQPLPGTLQDPTLEVHDGNGNLLLGNDDWQTAPTSAEVQLAGLAPSDPRESALLLHLTAGNYTSIVKGKGGNTGIALGEAYKLNN